MSAAENNFNDTNPQEIKNVADLSAQASNNLIYVGLGNFQERYDFKGERFHILVPKEPEGFWHAVLPSDIEGMRVNVSYAKAKTREELIKLFKAELGFDGIENLEKLEKDLKNKNWVADEPISDEVLNEFYQTTGRFDKEYLELRKKIKNIGLIVRVLVIISMTNLVSFFITTGVVSGLFFLASAAGFAVCKNLDNRTKKLFDEIDKRQKQLLHSQAKRTKKKRKG